MNPKERRYAISNSPAMPDSNGLQRGGSAQAGRTDGIRPHTSAYSTARTASAASQCQSDVYHGYSQSVQEAK